jgi:hypothetical protein
MFAPNWRFALSDRLDVNWPAQSGDEHAINTIQEAYVTRKFGQSTLVDLGRINVRNGVAASYNPTDYFKTGALRSITLLDPATLKDYRQGSVMVQGKTLWDSGSLTALYSPKLSDHANSGAFDPNLGGTNASGRFLVTLNQTIFADVTSQFLLFKESRQEAEVGFNLTGLIGKATVLNLEWSGGRRASGLTQALASQGLETTDDSAFRSKFAVSATHTASKKISITAEIDYNESGMQREQWDALRAGPLLSYNIYNSWALSQQELPTRKSAFLYLVWRDALINRLDLTALQRRDLVDGSRMMWMEARYRGSDSQWAIQFERDNGDVGSVFGSQPHKWVVLLLWRTYY